MKAWDWVLLVGGAMMIRFLSVTVMLAEDCGNRCTGTAFELQIGGQKVDGLYDMDAETCAEAWLDIERQVPSLWLKFVEVPVKRENT